MGQPSHPNLCIVDISAKCHPHLGECHRANVSSGLNFLLEASSFKAVVGAFFFAPRAVQAVPAGVRCAPKGSLLLGATSPSLTMQVATISNKFYKGKGNSPESAMLCRIVPACVAGSREEYERIVVRNKGLQKKTQE